VTASVLQGIALGLGNIGWCRYWLHWNYPQQQPWLMALDVRDVGGEPAELYEPDLRRRGFRGPLEVDFGDGAGVGRVWVVERTDESGAPFRSLL
jgi:hypothetical protein